MKNIKITPLFVLLATGLLISVSVTIYYLWKHNYDAEGMTGILGMIISFFLAIVLVVERLIVRANLVAFKTLCKLEGLFIGGLVLLYLLALLQQ